MDRAQSSVVGKALEAGIVVLYISLLTMALFAGAVPAYEEVAADRVADRTVAAAAQRIHQAVPPPARSVEATRAVDLPATIGGTAYRIRVEGRTLVLDHPDVAARARLALPTTVDRVGGEWASGESSTVEVTDGPDGMVVRLT